MIFIGPDGGWFRDADDIPAEEYYTEEMYETDLNVCYGDVRIGPHSYATGTALRRVDPAAFREGYLDALDNLRRDPEAHGFRVLDDEDEYAESEDEAVAELSGQ